MELHLAERTGTDIGAAAGGVSQLPSVLPSELPMIGTPVMETLSSDANVYLIYAGLDPLSWDIGIGFTPYFAGWIGHTGYFDSSNIGKTAAIVNKLIE